VPETPEAFGYDADGNLTNDGRWGYVWDAENRLISMQAISTVPTTAKMKLDFTYDYKGRRIQKVVSTNSGSAYVAEYTNAFVYDGWNMIGELNGANDALIRSYGWGLDLSGSMQGAGGVGGLVWVRTYGSGATTDFPCYDANGNVTTLVGGTEGLVLVGQNEYGPFGEPLRVTDEATNNPFRFSTKYEDTETGFLYYGYRYYNPGTGRWLSRDPVEERGGLDLYAFNHNEPISAIDPYGDASSVGRFDVGIEPGGLTGHYFANVAIDYVAGATKGCANCHNIRLAQIVDLTYGSFIASLLNPSGFRLDTFPSTFPWYPYQWHQDGSAGLGDEPGYHGAGWISQTIEHINGTVTSGALYIFEDCAICKDNPGSASILGCTSWGVQVGGVPVFQSFSSWGSGMNIPAVTPSPDFLGLFNSYISSFNQ